MMTDDDGRLLVLGGHGRSGSEMSRAGRAAHRPNYANNDGWYDDTSDGPVMARLVMYAENVTSVRYVDVEYPAWVIVAYPRYVPEVLDMVTMDEVLHDLFVREFADRHRALRRGAARSTIRSASTIRNEGRVAAVAGRAAHLESGVQAVVLPRHLADPVSPGPVPLSLQHPRPVELPARPAAARHCSIPYKLSVVPRYVHGAGRGGGRNGTGLPKLDRERDGVGRTGRGRNASFTTRTGRVLDDPYGPMRRYLFGLLRLAGEENEFKVEDKISSRLHNLPLMPMLNGDNLPDQHRAVQVPAPHRLHALHPQAVGAAATSSTRSTKAGCRARPTRRICRIRPRRPRPGAGSMPAC